MEYLYRCLKFLISSMVLVFNEPSSKMTSKHHYRFYLFVVIVLLITSSLAQDLASLGSILPKIDQNNFKLTPLENEYSLRITLPDGSFRDEIVELRYPGTPQQYLVVVGVTNTIYHGATATTTYSADKNGYIVKFRISSIPDDYRHISAAALKSAAG